MKKEIAAIYCRLSVEDAEKRAAESESIRIIRACERTDLPSNAFLRTRKKENFQSFYAKRSLALPETQARRKNICMRCFLSGGFAL